MPTGKILYCASTVSHLQNFHLPYIKALAEQGYQITACAEQRADIPFITDFFVVPFCKSITSPENVKNIFRLYHFFKQEKFTAINVHTTLAAAVVRAAVLLLPQKDRPKIFYTCHGYLFREKDGWRKWKYLLPEKICAYVNNVLLVMNQEDKRLAEKYHLYQDKLFSIPGMGVDFTRFDTSVTQISLRHLYGITDHEVLFVFAGEFSSRKNQQQLVAAFARAAEQMPDAKLVLAGQGALLNDCRQQVQQLNLQDKVIFPGQVADMSALYHCCDVCISASRIEGLPFNIMEAMYCGLPCIVSKVKGHTDLVEHKQTGYLYETEAELAGYMVQLYKNADLRQQLGQTARQTVKRYALEQVQPVIMQVYEENL